MRIIVRPQRQIVLPQSLDDFLSDEDKERARKKKEAEPAFEIQNMFGQKIGELSPNEPSLFDITNWWERELSSEQRSAFLAGRSWEGSIEERHALLRSFYDQAHRPAPPKAPPVSEREAARNFFGMAGREKPMNLNLPGSPPPLPEPSGALVIVTEQGQDIFTDDRRFDAHVRKGYGRYGSRSSLIVIDIFRSADRSPDAWEAGEEFPNNSEGIKAANEFLRGNGFRQTIV